MALRGLLVERRAEVLARWRALILDRTARPGTAGRGEERDPFRDPIGVALWQATAAVQDQLCGDGPVAAAPASLDDLVRIRSVQEIDAADAVRFVFLLRAALRDVLGQELERAPREERVALDDRIDAIALQVFESYVRSREKLFEIRAREVVSRSFVLVDRARRLIEQREGASPDPAEGKRS
jgi:hypothetical protein